MTLPSASTDNDRRPLRVALIANSDTAGGAESYLYRLYRGLVRLGVAEVTLIGSLPHWPEDLGKHLSVGVAEKLTRRRPILPQMKDTLSNAWKVRCALSAEEFDLVHIQFVREKLILPGFFTKNLPVLWTEHGPLAPNFPRFGVPWLRHMARRSSVMAVSDAVRTSFASIGVASRTIWNPLPATDTNAVRRADGATSNYVLYAGRIHSSKRLELMINAARLLPDIQFKVAGDGPDRERYAQEAPSNVEFLGHRTDVGALVAGCLAVVTTSGMEAREGSPLIVLESRQMGVPVLVPNDCHATNEARSLGATIYGPSPEELVSAIGMLGSNIQTIPLEPAVAEARGEDEWLEQVAAVMQELSESDTRRRR